MYDDGTEREDTDKELSELDYVLMDFEDLIDHAHENNKEIRDMEDLILYRRKLLSPEELDRE